MRVQLLSVMLCALVCISFSADAKWLFPRKEKIGPLVKNVWVFETDFIGEFNNRMAVAESFRNAKIHIVRMPDLEDDAYIAASVESFRQNRSVLTSETLDLAGAAVGVLRAYGTPDVIVHSFHQQHDWRFLEEIRLASKGQTHLIHLQANDPRGTPTRVTPKRLAQAKEAWASTFARMPRPIIAVLIGGQTQSANFTSPFAKDLGERLKNLAKENQGSLLITNSRRTTEIATKSLLETISGVPVYFYDMKNERNESTLYINMSAHADYNKKSDASNPYLGILAYADYIVTTGDSFSMLSDALATGKPVYVYAPDSTVEQRHKDFIVNLYQQGRIKPLQKTLQSWSYTPLDRAAEIRDAFLAETGCEQNLL
jgi:mitochondrial fission protein ELM1